MTTKAKRKTKRRTRAELQIEEAKRIATLITSALIDGNPNLAVPGLIRDPRLAPALAVWREVTPLLSARGILDETDRLQLAMLCYWYAEFVVAADDLLKRGYSVMVKTVSGDRMPRRNASAGRRDHAFDKVSELSAKFGLTPHDRYALARSALTSGQYADGELPFDRQPRQTDVVASWEEVVPAKVN